MTIIQGPYCFVCGGKNVVRRWVNGVVAWTEQGPRHGKVQRDVCLDCEEKLSLKGGKK